jgi:hypothetical protein
VKLELRIRAEDIKLTGDARGLVILPLHEVIKHMSDPRELRALGAALKPNAHKLAERLLNIAAERNEGDPVPIPPSLLSEVVVLLLALSGSRRGRPPKETTLQLRQLLAEVGTKLGAARATSVKTGEPVHNLRRRLRSKPSKPKRGRGT